MAEESRLDLSETGRQRGWRETGQWASSLWGILALAGFSALAASYAGWIVANHGHPADPSRHIVSTEWVPAIKVIVPVFAGLLAALVVFTIVGLWKTGRAPLEQRNEARQRLRQIQEAARSIAISPTDLRAAPSDQPKTFTVLCTVRNDGRMAQFEVTIDAVDGARAPLAAPHSHLLWWDRDEVVVEEIPPGGSRPIAIGEVKREKGRLLYRIISPFGLRLNPPSEAEIESLTVWIRIAVRNQPTVSYTRRIGITIQWDVRDEKPALRFAPAPPDAEMRMSAPSVESLLDF